MIVKERQVPLRLLKLAALQRRLPEGHTKLQGVAADLARSSAGYRGEESVDHYLKFLPCDAYLILHDLRLPGTHGFFQMDTLILCSSTLIVLEVKNIAGEVYFENSFEQMIRSSERGQEVFQNPLLQAERQAWQLREWLKRNEYRDVPVEFLVVLANERSLVRADTKLERVIRSASLPGRIERMNVGRHLSAEELLGLSRQLVESDQPADVDVLQRFLIKRGDLLTGVHCPACAGLPMQYRWRSWHCLRCGWKSKDAHVAAIHDYGLLWSSQVKNAQIRTFLQLDCDQLTRRLLADMKLPYEGERKSRVYFIDKFEKV
ncbi:nuclease-related domain-containing protein [Ectobacillus ponti]|uniref:NERD domain-containing protein n=1 Tax=Ectobacillus ponti TaxID=2961894 RepID=A0AA41XA95_9BACI|nr:nuclease-related domain-containing protein [Ectobacillus ponti]MCP8968326.1 NERD domain-containing protein [Ectobacillus ponti]